MESNIIPVSYAKAAQLGFEIWKKGLCESQTIFLQGAPGIGKTACAESMAALIQAANPNEEVVCVVRDLTDILPEDIGGLPGRYDDSKSGIRFVRRDPNEWALQVCRPGAKGVLILDDLPAASPAVQVAARQTALRRVLGDQKISPGVLVVLTGNRREDKSAATTLPAHFRNSVMTLTVEADLEEWISWYTKGERPSMLWKYLRYKPSAFSQLPREASLNGSFATPRTWTKLGEVFQIAQDQDLFMEVASGYVGEGPALELLAFMKVHEMLIDPETALDHPEQVDISSVQAPDRRYVLCTGVADVVNKRRKLDNIQGEKALLQMPALLERCYSDGSVVEALSLTLTTLITLGTDAHWMGAALTKHRHHPAVMQINKALSGMFSRMAARGAKNSNNNNSSSPQP